ncbi:MAG: hypothetical protein ACYC8T_38480 [Myxococcaceae bacterium]
MRLFHAIRSLATVLVVGTLCSACAWHRLEPPLFQRPAVQRLKWVVGLYAADDDTSLDDVRVIARHWTRWGAFREVQFPYRSGDPVDVVVEVRLRQTGERYRASNFWRELGLAASLYTLSPVLGARRSEIHDVRVQCRHGVTAGAPLGVVLRTEIEYGFGANPYEVAKALDDEEMEKVAGWALEAVTAACRPAAPPAAPPGL